MKLFLLDLWHDLREKRLWPVAAALLIALIAVPVVLSKPAAEPAPAPPAQPEPQADRDLKGLAKVVLADQEAGKGSKLNLFDSSDPFRPPKSAKPDDATSDTGAPTSGAAAGADTGFPSSGGTGVGGSIGDTGGGLPTTPPQPQTPTKTTSYTYVIDVTFKHGDRTRKIKGMDRLETLPNDESPLLLFLGVSANANSAVFLVDSRLEPNGEGKCKPSADDCSFLYLGAGNEHFFTDENDEPYTLRIDEIRRVKVSDKAKGSRARSGSSKRKGGQKSGRPARTAEQGRPFVPPLLVDLVSVSSDEFDRSSGGGGDR